LADVKLNKLAEFVKINHDNYKSLTGDKQVAIKTAMEDAYRRLQV
tara:strand:- start:499 stop:633 length:135 start_codon:yes stop_codon:yes gene_type:complete